MAAFTYQEAVKIFKQHAQDLENNLGGLTKNIEKFLVTTRKKIESDERKKERASLKKLQKKLR